MCGERHAFAEPRGDSLCHRWLQPLPGMVTASASHATATHQFGEGEARLLAARQELDRVEREVAREAKAAQVLARLGGWGEGVSVGHTNYASRTGTDSEEAHQRMGGQVSTRTSGSLYDVCMAMCDNVPRRC